MARKLEWDRTKHPVRGPLDSSSEIGSRAAAEDRAVFEKPQTSAQQRRAEARRAYAMMVAKTEAEKAAASRGGRGN